MIKKLGLTDANNMANIHISALKNDFLPSLGINFLEFFYKALINQKGIFAYGDYSKGILSGFVLGTDDMDSLFKKVLKKNFITFTILVGLALLKKPSLIFKIIETFLYPGKDSGPKAELVVIAILSKLQGKGLGRKLVKRLEAQFKENKIKQYKLTVHSDKGAVKFYEKLSYQKYSSFRLYGKDWLIFTKKIK